MPKEDLNDIDAKRLRRADHDLLIRLESKVDDISVDIRELNDGTKATLALHEKRISDIEKTILESDPKVNIKKLDEVYNWMHDTRLSLKFLVASIVAISSIITFLLKVVIDSFNLFNR